MTEQYHQLLALIQAGNTTPPLANVASLPQCLSSSLSDLAELRVMDSSAIAIDHTASLSTQFDFKHLYPPHPLNYP